MADELLRIHQHFMSRRHCRHCVPRLRRHWLANARTSFLISAFTRCECFACFLRCRKISQSRDLSRCVSQSNPAAVIGTIVDDLDYSAAQLARLQADFLEPDHEIFGGDVATSILMIDTLLQLQKAELDEADDLATINKKAIQETLLLFI